jgi:hypothetical protein
MSAAEEKRYFVARLRLLERQNRAMREVLNLIDWRGERQSIVAPEDAEVAALCERWGYGAVMGSAARQWRCKDETGAFTVGPCAFMVERALQ